MTTPAIHGTKRCSKCGVEKRVLAFAACSKASDGLDCWCRDCHNENSHQNYISRAHRRRNFAMPEGA